MAVAVDLTANLTAERIYNYLKSDGGYVHGNTLALRCHFRRSAIRYHIWVLRHTLGKDIINKSRVGYRLGEL